MLEIITKLVKHAPHAIQTIKSIGGHTFLETDIGNPTVLKLAYDQIDTLLMTQPGVPVKGVDITTRYMNEISHTDIKTVIETEDEIIITLRKGRA